MTRKWMFTLLSGTLLVSVGTLRAQEPPAGAPPPDAMEQGGNMNKTTPAGPELGETIVASNDAGEFTLLPGSLPGMLGDATVVRVQMQRGALGALGLTVNEERAADLIQVDLLVGDDGQPQALRLAQTTD